eukprot:526304_1
MPKLTRWYAKSYRKWPYVMAFATCFIKGSVSDGITQTKLENTEKMDSKRNTRFAVWSGMYCGCVQHVIYNILYQRLFPVVTPLNRVAVTMMDCFIHVPLLFFPIYYVFRSLIFGGSLADGLNEYWNEKWNVLPAYWKLWLPSMFCIMSFVPIEFRIFAIGSVSVIWLIIMSYLVPMTKTETLEIECIRFD